MARTEVTGKQIKDKSVDLADDVTGVLPVANGGTGSETLPLNNVLVGNGTGALQTIAPGAAGQVLKSNGSAWVASDIEASMLLGPTGPAGAAGADGADGADGQGFTWRGAYSSSNSYVAYDTVSYAGASWLCVSATSASPDADPSKWNLLAAKGDQGIAGVDGAIGADGADGQPGADGATGPTGPTGPPGPSTVADDLLTIQNVTDTSKEAQFSAGSITTGTRRTYTLPDVSSTLEVTANKGQADGYAALDETGKVPTSQLPLFGAVDSVNGQTGVVVVTASDVGLGNVDNTSDADKPISDATQSALDDKSDVGHGHATSDVTGLDTALSDIDTALGGKEPTITAGTTGEYYRGDKTFQTLDKTAVGLSNVDNTSDEDKPVSTATSTALSGKEPTIAAGMTGEYWRGDKAWATLDKDAVGLDQVDNTSDLDKPVSDATQTALDGKSDTGHGHAVSDVTGLQDALDDKQDTSARGQAGGYASLDSGGKVPVEQLPHAVMTYEGVVDVSTNTPTLSDATGDAGQVYRVTVGGIRDYGSGAITANVGDYLIHSGTVWQVSDTTDAVATVNGYTGNVTLTKSDVGLGDVDNTADSAKNVLSASKLTTARNINGVAFDGTGNITVADDTKEPVINAGSAGQYWAGDKSWQTLDKTAVGLANVDNTSDANKPVSDATATALSSKEPTIASGTTSQYYRGDKTWQTLDKTAVGLSNVDNTSDATKNSASATLTNKTISGADNTITNVGISSLSATGTPGSSTYLRGDGTWAAISNGTFADTAFVLQDDGDATKQLQFQLSGLTTGTTRTLTIPDASSTLEVTANKGQAGGYASLDEAGKVPTIQMPAGAVVDGVTLQDTRFQFTSNGTPIGDPIPVFLASLDGGSPSSTSSGYIDGGTL